MRIYETKIRQAISDLTKQGKEIHHFRMGIDQEMQIMNEGIVFASVVTGKGDLNDLTKMPPMTIAGRPIVRDEKLAEDCIYIEDIYNHILLILNNLPIPQPFQK